MPVSLLNFDSYDICSLRVNPGPKRKLVILCKAFYVISSILGAKILWFPQRPSRAAGLLYLSFSFWLKITPRIFTTSSLRIVLWELTFHILMTPLENYVGSL
jgi:hypothetical protein